LLVKARVIALESAPHFLVITEAEDFQGETWTVQCEILEVHMLGWLPADEEPIPEMSINGQLPVYDFFAFGQP
jgi:hypothetical protein